MKNTTPQSQTKSANTRLNANKHRPEIRDNLDSRINEEQELKGDDITNNKKEHRKPEKKKDK
jgi:hypothetical protein